MWTQLMSLSKSNSLFGLGHFGALSQSFNLLCIKRMWPIKEMWPCPKTLEIYGLPAQSVHYAEMLQPVQEGSEKILNYANNENSVRNKHCNQWPRQVQGQGKCPRSSWAVCASKAQAHLESCIKWSNEEYHLMLGQIFMTFPFSCTLF